MKIEPRRRPPPPPHIPTPCLPHPPLGQSPYPPFCPSRPAPAAQCLRLRPHLVTALVVLLAVPPEPHFTGAHEVKHLSGAPFASEQVSDLETVLPSSRLSPHLRPRNFLLRPPPFPVLEEVLTRLCLVITPSAVGRVCVLCRLQVLPSAAMPHSDMVEPLHRPFGRWILEPRHPVLPSVESFLRHVSRFSPLLAEYFPYDVGNRSGSSHGDVVGASILCERTASLAAAQK